MVMYICVQYARFWTLKMTRQGFKWDFVSVRLGREAAAFVELGPSLRICYMIISVVEVYDGPRAALLEFVWTEEV